MLNRTETVIIDAEDTDVVTLAAKVSHELAGITGIYHKKNIFDCKKLFTSEIADIVVQFSFMPSQQLIAYLDSADTGRNQCINQ